LVLNTTPLPPRVATSWLRCRSPFPRPQGFAPPKSPLQASDVATSGRPLLPWAWSQLDSLMSLPTEVSEEVRNRQTPKGLAAPSRLVLLPRRATSPQQRIGLSDLKGAIDAAAEPRRVGRMPMRPAGSPKTAALARRLIGLVPKDRTAQDRSLASVSHPKMCPGGHLRSVSRRTPAAGRYPVPSHPKTVGF
jgi:hypothetical protein